MLSLEAYAALFLYSLAMILRLFLVSVALLVLSPSVQAERVLLAGSGVSVEPVVLGQKVSFLIRGLKEKGYSYRELSSEMKLVLTLPHVTLRNGLQIPLRKQELFSRVDVRQKDKDASIVFSFTSPDIVRPQVREVHDGLELIFESETPRAQYVAQKQPSNRFALATWKNEVTERPLRRPQEKQVQMKKKSQDEKIAAKIFPPPLEEETALPEVTVSKQEKKLSELKEIPRDITLPDAPGVFRQDKKDVIQSKLAALFQEGKLPFRVSVDVLYLEQNKESVLTLTNTTDSPLTLRSVVKEIVSPGTKEEHRRLAQDLKVYPRETTLVPNASQEILFLYRGNLKKSEKVLEVSFLPKESLIGGNPNFPKVGAALLALVQPRPRSAKIRWERDEEVLSFVNEGNISAYFHSGKYCVASDDCYSIPAFRIYPGRSVGIPVSGEYEVKITEQLETASHEFTLPPVS